MKNFKRVVCLLVTLVSVLTLGLFVGCKKDSGTSYAICNDTSNAIRAFQLLKNKGIEIEDKDGKLPYNTDATELSFTGEKWTTKNGDTISLVAENLLVQVMADYDYVCLPCNTALTGNVNASLRKYVEDDAEQVSLKANIIAARTQDYKTNAEYKNKIDALVEVLLSNDVSQLVNNLYNGNITCNASSQIDLRQNPTQSTNGGNKQISVCASEVPHAEILNSTVVSQALAAKGFTIKVTVIDWTEQNQAVANGDYDANYFQHVPYLDSQNTSGALFAACKVHYEPLGVYYGKAKK